MIYFDEDKHAYDETSANSLGVKTIANIDDETWMKYAGTDKWDIVDGKFKDITGNDEYKAKEAATKATELVEKNYELKADIAYTGIYYNYNNQKLLFQTNSASSNAILSTALKFTIDTTLTSVNWKFWTTDKTTNIPVWVTLTKDQFTEFTNFATKLTNEAFAVENAYNTKIAAFSTDELLNEATMQTFLDEMQKAYAAINTAITLTEAK